MLRPVRCLPTDQPRKLRRPRLAVRAGVIQHGACPGWAIERVEVIRYLAAHLPQRRQIGADHRHAGRQCLGDRQAVAFGEGGEEQGAGARQQGSRAVIGQGAEFGHMAAQMRAAFEQVEHMLVLPASAADDIKMRDLRLSARRHLPPQVQQQDVVLAGLHRAEDDEIGGRGGAGRGRRQTMDAERGDQDFRDRPRQRGPQRLFGGLRIDDHRIGQRGRGRHPFGVPQRLPWALIFRMRERDQIMDQRDKGRPRLPQPTDRRGAVEGAVRDQQEDAATLRGDAMAQSAPAAPHGKASHQAERDASGPRQPPPGGPTAFERIKQRDDLLPGQDAEAAPGAFRGHGAFGFGLVQPIPGIGHLHPVDAGWGVPAHAADDSGDVQDHMH